MEPQIQRWSAKRKVELLLSLIKGEKKLVDVCRERHRAAARHLAARYAYLDRRRSLANR